MSVSQQELVEPAVVPGSRQPRGSFGPEPAAPASDGPAAGAEDTAAEKAPARASGNWARTPERSNALAMRVMSWIALAFGRRIARTVLHPIALYFLLFSPDARRHSARYLERALGRPARWRDLYAHFHAFSATILDRVYLLRGHMHLFDISLRAEALDEAAFADGRGAFLLGAHFGSFEVLRVMGESHGQRRIAMVMYPDNARLINQTLQAVAPGYTPEIIALGRMESMLSIREWLDRGGLAGMLGDRVLPGESLRATRTSAPFLGRTAVFGDGPFRLAALLRRRMYFMAGIYLGGNRYEVRFEPLADFSGPAVAPAERERHIQEAVRAFAARLETLCHAHPYNWFNFHDFWREESN